jgi:hypothetical protein
VYGLIDMAFSGRCYKTLKGSKTLSRRSLYDLRDIPDEKLAEVSPTLIYLSSSDAAAWREVMQATDGWPMVSLLVTTESLDDLALRLDPWCVVDADDENYCLRFADTRRLPDIVSTLTPEQHGEFFGPAKVWLYRDRAAQWRELPLPETSSAPADKPSLNSKQCGILIKASEPDEIIDSLCLNQPALAQTISSFVAHSALCNALQCADQYGITEPDRIDWCTLWLRHPGLNELPQAMQWLEEFKEKNMTFEELHAAIDQEMGKA